MSIECKQFEKPSFSFTAPEKPFGTLKEKIRDIALVALAAVAASITFAISTAFDLVKTAVAIPFVLLVLLITLPVALSSKRVEVTIIRNRKNEEFPRQQKQLAQTPEHLLELDRINRRCIGIGPEDGR